MQSRCNRSAPVLRTSVTQPALTELPAIPVNQDDAVSELEFLAPHPRDLLYPGFSAGLPDLAQFF